MEYRACTGHATRSWARRVCASQPQTVVAITIVLAVMLLGLPACAARMEGGKEKAMEKGDAMEKSDSRTKQEKAMMKES